MRDGCKCEACKHKVNEYFCPLCGTNFNECESEAWEYYWKCAKCWKLDKVTNQIIEPQEKK